MAIEPDIILVAQQPDMADKRQTDTALGLAPFDYRRKAFDKIEFGAHDDYSRDTFSLLNKSFTYTGHPDSYYGLSRFRLNQIGDYPDAKHAVQQLEEISRMISAKYGQGQLKNSLLLKGSFSASSPVIRSDVAPSSLPEDNGAMMIYKQWAGNDNQIGIRIGYLVSYLDNNVLGYAHIRRNPKFILYLDFESLHLEQLIQERADAKRKLDKDKDATKF